MSALTRRSPSTARGCRLCVVTRMPSSWNLNLHGGSCFEPKAAESTSLGRSFTCRPNLPVPYHAMRVVQQTRHVRQIPPIPVAPAHLVQSTLEALTGIARRGAPPRARDAPHASRSSALTV